MSRHCLGTGGGGGGASAAPAEGGNGGSIHPVHGLNCHPSEGAKGGASGGVAKHACRSIVALGPAAVWLGGRRRSTAQGGRARRRGGRRARRRRPANGRRQGWDWEARRAAVLPSLSEAASLPSDLVQEVPVKARVDAAETVRPLGCGPDLPRLRQGGPADLGDQGEEGMHRGDHL